MFDKPHTSDAMRIYVLENAPVLALTLDPSHCVTGANAHARQFLGETCIGHPFAEQVVDFTRTLDLPSLILRKNAVHPLTLSGASGVPETLHFRFFPLPDGTLALGGLDFPEQQKLRNEMLKLNGELNNLTRQLHQANAELHELNELKNRFIGMAAHDLRKPVGVIMTYNEFVLDEAGDHLDDEQRGFLSTSMAAAEGMKRLIDNFLDVSVIESGHLRIDRSRADVAQLLAGVLPLVRLIAAKKQIELITDVVSGGLRFTGDLSKLQQVLVNLVSNAIEHSKVGQRVWLSAHLADTDLVFSVRDEGPGIAPDDQKQLFAPFARAGTRKTGGERSVGLGLAIARAVVEAHDGRIWVESTPGAGANFLFSLPVEMNTINQPK